MDLNEHFFNNFSSAAQSLKRARMTTNQRHNFPPENELSQRWSLGDIRRIDKASDRRSRVGHRLPGLVEERRVSIDLRPPRSSGAP
ncbi:MAG: hypothetical protein WA882_17520, partial [Geitlerinemataceae cyanobacterium]